MFRLVETPLGFKLNVQEEARWISLRIFRGVSEVNPIGLWIVGYLYNDYSRWIYSLLVSWLLWSAAEAMVLQQLICLQNTSTAYLPTNSTIRFKLFFKLTCINWLLFTSYYILKLSDISRFQMFTYNYASAYVMQ